MLAIDSPAQVQLVAVMQYTSGEPADPATWSKGANNESHPDYYRIFCIYELFMRYAHVGMSLGQLAQLLNRPTWIDEPDVLLLTCTTGKIPVIFSPGDTLFSVVFFPSSSAPASLYILIEGEVDVSSFVSALKAEPIPVRLLNAKVLDFSFRTPSLSVDYPQSD